MKANFGLDLFKAMEFTKQNCYNSKDNLKITKQMVMDALCSKNKKFEDCGNKTSLLEGLEQKRHRKYK